jgi:glycosyltransferase involved in cell wall biosynthesis
MPSPPSALPISVVIPAYNRADELACALEGIQRQSRPPSECVVVDDASTDRTAEVASAFGARVVRHEANQGAAAARNTGVHQARQPWIAFLDSDDEWLPHHIETVWAGRRGGDVAVSGSAFVSSGSEMRVHGTPFGRPYVISGPGRLIYPENVIPASGVLVEREALLACGLYDASLRYSEDFDLWLRLCERGTIRCLPDVTLIYRAHPGQKSAARSDLWDAQDSIARRSVERQGSGAMALRARRGVRRWDELRSSLRNGERADAMRKLAGFGHRPVEVLGVVGIWGWRRLMSRRARALRAPCV